MALRGWISAKSSKVEMRANVLTLPRALLSVSVFCLALAIYSLLEGEVWDGVFGLALAALLLGFWRWSVRN
jgi:hypothetical protein